MFRKRGQGFAFVEFLSTCPTNWGLSPAKALDFVSEKMIPYYPLGKIKDTTWENIEIEEEGR